MNNKTRYFLKCASKLGQAERLKCPSCGSSESAVISRKYCVTALRRCGHCALLYRTPTTTAIEDAQFYQEDYSQGFTSSLPDDDALQILLKNKFVGCDKDYTRYTDVLTALGVKPGQRVLDFGCSWGYGSWQMREKGYEVTAFEISTPRCRYAREKLGINAYDRLEDLTAGDFDVFFSAHVLEHVPSVSEVFAYARKKLKPGGLFVAFTPNGSSAFRAARPAAWQRLWGMVHPNFLDEMFYRSALPAALLASSPYDYKAIARSWTKEDTGVSIPTIDGIELMAAVRMEK